MISAFVIVYIMAFGPQSEWPEKEVWHHEFKTDAECWARIDEFQQGWKTQGPVEISFHFRCGGET
jgi:hypothetical protein